MYRCLRPSHTESLTGGRPLMSKIFTYHLQPSATICDHGHKKHYAVTLILVGDWSYHRLPTKNHCHCFKIIGRSVVVGDGQQSVSDGRRSVGDRSAINC